MKNWNFLKIIQFSSKQCCVFAHSTNVGTRQEASLPTNVFFVASCLLCAKSWGYTKKVFEFAFFFLFLLKMSGNIREISIFHFWAKAVLLLNSFGTGILWKIRNTKKLKHLIFLSLKLREIHSKNSKLLNVHWIFIKTMLFFARSINVGKQQDAPSPRTPDVTACGLRWWKS